MLMNQWLGGQQTQQDSGPTQLQYNAESGNFYAPSTDTESNDPRTSFGMPNMMGLPGVQQPTGGQAYTISDDAQRAIWEQHQNSLLSQQQPGSVVERSGVQYVNAPSHVPNTLSQKSDARDNMAQVHRGMWEDYQRRFIPAENALMASVGNHGQALEQVGRSVDQQYATQAREHQRGLSGFGIGMTPDQQQAFDRSQAVNHASAKAGAMNTARMGLQDRDLAAMAGGLSTLAQQRQNPGQP
ncbi:hypothetical protein [Thioalkalivibrio sp. ALE12]|uniref:hypothetical protein n=1 Tax=Thioalkalivibrio sp. ALE12 TaxID=1158170 RepID=UPI00035DBE23|nr:hypothetical protein [Thioalkalivibrio sp. ALE12]